ncbi:MAG: hypothetical protein V4590_01025 [Bacteroidota bacterium]
MKRNLIHVNFFGVLVIHLLCGVQETVSNSTLLIRLFRGLINTQESLCKILIVTILIALSKSGFSQHMLPEFGKYALEAGVSCRVFDRLPLEVNAALTHESGYGFQLAVNGGQYSMDEQDGTYFDSGKQYINVTMNYEVSSWAFRPAFFIATSFKKHTNVNCIGINYGWSHHQLVVNGNLPVESRLKNSSITRHHLSMELVNQQKFYFKERWILSFSTMLGVNCKFLLADQPEVPYELAETYYRPGQGYTIYDACYVGCWIGIGYKIIK